MFQAPFLSQSGNTIKKVLDLISSTLYNLTNLLV